MLGTSHLERIEHSIGVRRSIMARYLFKLEPPLSTAEKVQEIAKLGTKPQVLRNPSDGSRYVEVDSVARHAIMHHLQCASNAFLVMHVPAEKALSEVSIAPALGLDATLPQHRPATSPVPLQNEWPVPYFFYGTLADPARLRQMLEIEGEPKLLPASIQRGNIKIWGGKYRALVDGSELDTVSGSAFMVESKADEDLLRVYEGRNYEVVRCEILTGTVAVSRGLTFRFCGNKAGLKEFEGQSCGRLGKYGWV
ncbi:hypothetical protein NX059_002495 [Plenodomus lindquistii]|nr:hypothetical protein NX059_002495 [Plenodomus lindquistii]